MRRHTLLWVEPSPTSFDGRRRARGLGSAAIRKVGGDGAKMKSAAAFGGACELVFKSKIIITLSSYDAHDCKQNCGKSYKLQAFGIIKVVNYF